MFGDQQIVDLTASITLMNAQIRLQISLGMKIKIAGIEKPLKMRI
ncbi:hypothetical protein [Sphingobacterium multivorum]|nr:hypothetical protein [Sphingobacterium multivorum]